jgi:hypothetical protein
VQRVNCVASASAAEHQNAIQYDFPMFYRPMKAAELIAQLG